MLPRAIVQSINVHVRIVTSHCQQIPVGGKGNTHHLRHSRSETARNESLSRAHVISQSGECFNDSIVVG